MDSTKNLSGYPASVDLKYYALSFQEKQREAKQKEKELLKTIAENEILKIKKNPWCTFTGNRIINSDDISKIEDEFIDNYFVDLLNFNYLLVMRGIRSHNFKLLRLLLSFCTSSENDTVTISTDDKSSFLSSSIKVISNIVNWIAKIPKRIVEVCSSLIFRSVAIYYCYELSSHTQRLIVPLKDVSLLRETNRSNVSNVYFLKNHSPYDVVLLLTSLYWNDVKIPVIFFDNSAKPWLCWVLCKIGATLNNFEDFRTKDDDLDLEKLQTVVNQMLIKKCDIAFCLKDDIEKEIDLFLRMVESNLRNSNITDALFTTVNFSRERLRENVIETNFISDQKKLNACNFLKTNVGFTRVTFSQPFSIKKIISTLMEKSPNLMGTPRIDSKQEVKARLSWEFSNSQILMSTNLVSFILLYKFRDGVKFNDLVKEVEKFKKEIIYLSKPLGFTGDTRSVVNHAIDILRSKLEITKTNDECIIKPALHLPHILELSRLSSVTLNYFILDVIILHCLAIIFKSKLEDFFKSGENQRTFYYIEFIDKIDTLCEVLSMEFIFENYNQSLSGRISEAMFKCIEQEYFTKNEKLLTDEERWGHRLAKHLESDDEEDSTRNQGDVYTVNFDSNVDLYPKIMFYKRSLQPIIDAYVVAIEHMETLITHDVIYPELVTQIFNKLKFSFDNHRLEYPESVSLTYVYNSIKLLEKWNVLKSYTVDDIKVLYLAKEYKHEQTLSEIKKKVTNFQ